MVSSCLVPRGIKQKYDEHFIRGVLPKLAGESSFLDILLLWPNLSFACLLGKNQRNKGDSIEYCSTGPLHRCAFITWAAFKLKNYDWNLIWRRKLFHFPGEIDLIIKFSVRCHTRLNFDDDFIHRREIFMMKFFKASVYFIYSFTVNKHVFFHQSTSKRYSMQCLTGENLIND